MKTNGVDLLHHLNKLISENARLKAFLAEQQYIGAHKEKEIQLLKVKSTINIEAASALDNKSMELEMLQDCVTSMQQQRAGAENREEDYLNALNNGIREHHQLQDLQQQYVYLQTQYNDLKYQLELVVETNIMLQQQNARLLTQHCEQGLIKKYIAE